MNVVEELISLFTEMKQCKSCSWYGTHVAYGTRDPDLRTRCYCITIAERHPDPKKYRNCKEYQPHDRTK